MITYEVSLTGEILVKLPKHREEQLLSIIRHNKHHCPKKIDEFVSSCLQEATRTTFFKPRTLL